MPEHKAGKTASSSSLLTTFYWDFKTYTYERLKEMQAIVDKFWRH